MTAFNDFVEMVCKTAVRFVNGADCVFVCGNFDSVDNDFAGNNCDSGTFASGKGFMSSIYEITHRRLTKSTKIRQDL